MMSYFKDGVSFALRCRDISHCHNEGVVFVDGKPFCESHAQFRNEQGCRHEAYCPRAITVYVENNGYCSQHGKEVQYTLDLRKENAKRLGIKQPEV